MKDSQCEVQKGEGSGNTVRKLSHYRTVASLRSFSLDQAELIFGPYSRESKYPAVECLVLFRVDTHQARCFVRST